MPSIAMAKKRAIPHLKITVTRRPKTTKILVWVARLVVQNVPRSLVNVSKRLCRQEEEETVIGGEVTTE